MKSSSQSIDVRPESSSAVCRFDGDDWTVSVSWDVVDNSVEPEQICISAPTDRNGRPKRPVTAEAIRRLHIGKVVQELRRAESAARHAQHQLAQTEQGLIDIAEEIHQNAEAGSFTGYNAALAAQADLLRRQTKLAEVFSAPQGPQRGRRLDPQLLEAVAEVYREARRLDNPVQAAVAQRFAISKSTAAKRIMEARKAGLLADLKPTRGRTRK